MVERDLSADKNQAQFLLWKYKPSQLHFPFTLLSLGRGQKEKGRKILCIKLHTLNCMHESLLSPQGHILGDLAKTHAPRRHRAPLELGAHPAGCRQLGNLRQGLHAHPFLTFPEDGIGLHSQMGFLALPFSARSLWEQLGVPHPSVWDQRDLPPGASPSLHLQPACWKEPAILHQYTQQSKQLPSAVIGRHLTLPHTASCHYN